MNKSRKGAKFLALLLGASLIAASCGDDDGGGEGAGTDSTAVVGAETTAAGTETSAAGETTAPETETTAPTDAPSGGTVVYGQEQEFAAYNNNTSAQNAAANGYVLNRVLPREFAITADGAELEAELMVSVELVSEDPQVVEHVINPDAVWSDGEPIDCDDYVLFWIANSGIYLQKNPDGSVATDPETGSELPLFDSAGTSGFEQIESVDCSEDGKMITTNYSSPFPDWQNLFNGYVPAHIVEQQSGVDDIIAAVEAADEAQLALAADFYNNGWVLNPGEIPPEITPSGGPFALGTWEPGASLTLVPNESYWGTPPAADEIVIRYIPQEAQAQALANGEIQAMDPQPNPELVAQLQGMSGITVETGDQFTYEHLDFNFNVPALQDPNVREAFALCVPRQAIVDSLVKNQNPDAIVANNRWIYTFEPDYQDNSGGLYLEPDIAQAQSLLEQAGQTGLTLRIGYRTPNQRRTDTVALIKQSCDQAGFSIQDAGTDSFFGVELNQGDFDVALFGWAGAPFRTGTSAAFETGGGNNNGNYTNPEVDELIAEFNTTLDPERGVELANQIDMILWEDLVTLPMFTFPGIFAVADGTTGVVYNPTQFGLTWNAEKWATAS